MISGRFKVLRFTKPGEHRLMADLEYRQDFEKAKEAARHFWMCSAQGEAEIEDQKTGERWKVDYYGVVVEIPAEKQLALF